MPRLPCAVFPYLFTLRPSKPKMLIPSFGKKLSEKSYLNVDAASCRIQATLISPRDLINAAGMPRLPCLLDMKLVQYLSFGGYRLCVQAFAVDGEAHVMRRAGRIGGGGQFRSFRSPGPARHPDTNQINGAFGGRIHDLPPRSGCVRRWRWTWPPSTKSTWYSSNNGAHSRRISGYSWAGA